MNYLICVASLLCALMTPGVSHAGYPGPVYVDFEMCSGPDCTSGVVTRSGTMRIDYLYCQAGYCIGWYDPPWGFGGYVYVDPTSHFWVETPDLLIYADHTQGTCFAGPWYANKETGRWRGCARW